MLGVRRARGGAISNLKRLTDQVSQGSEQDFRVRPLEMTNLQNKPEEAREICSTKSTNPSSLMTEALRTRSNLDYWAKELR